MHYYSGLDFLGAAPYCLFNLFSRPVLVFVCTYTFSLSKLLSTCFRNHMIPPLILYHILIYHVTYSYVLVYPMTIAQKHKAIFFYRTIHDPHQRKGHRAGASRHVAKNAAAPTTSLASKQLLMKGAWRSQPHGGRVISSEQLPNAPRDVERIQRGGCATRNGSRTG